MDKGRAESGSSGQVRALARYVFAATLVRPADGVAVVPAVLLVFSGLFGPMLTGGVSSRVPSIAGPARKSRRRAQSRDVAGYGISGTLGPAVVAASPAYPLRARRS